MHLLMWMKVVEVAFFLAMAFTVYSQIVIRPSDDLLVDTDYHLHTKGESVYHVHDELPPVFDTEPSQPSVPVDVVAEF